MGGKYTDCFVSYLDILGFKKKVEKTKKSPELLKKLIDALKINASFTQAGEKETSQDGKLDIRSFFFSDSFVFMMKAEEKNLHHLFLIIRYLQDRLWESNLCLRGAVVKGKMYWPTLKENIILGPAMIRAYWLESEIAIYPRIVVSQDLYEFIESGCVYTWSENGDSLLSDFIKKDKDGVYFFDILNPNITRKKEEGIIKNNGAFSIVWNPENENNYAGVKDDVIRIIKNGTNSKKEEIRQKYEWLKSYLEESQGDQ